MQRVTVILAGGAGKRIGGDKPLRRLRGKPLIAHVAARCPTPIWISASDWRLADHGLLVPDLPSLGQGPLVGVWSSLIKARAAAIRSILTVPVDAPFLPLDLGERLQAALGDRLAAVATTPTGWHAASALWRVAALPKITELLAARHWSLKGALRALDAVAVDFGAAAEPLFFNINTLADLAAAEAKEE